MVKLTDLSKNIEYVMIDNPGEFEYSETCDSALDKDNIVKRMEKTVRGSMEYGDYIQFLRQNVEMDTCAFFKGVSKKTNKKIKIEVHHAPLTLYDVCKLILDKAVDTGEEINVLQLARTAMEIHYKNRIGLIPLSKTLHEVVHKSDKLVIPMYMIYGDFLSFMEEYNDYIELEENKGIRKKIEKLVADTKSVKEDTFDVLEAKFTYIMVDGFEMLTKIEDSGEVKEAAKENKKEAA